MSDSQVTISLLPVSLSLLTIPRHRLGKFTAPVIHQILRPNPTFLNLTCNEIELSIFAESVMLDEFQSIAHKEKHRQRSRSGSDSSRKSSLESRPFEPIEISNEKWSVLQIDSHSDPIDGSGARVNELSAPLAAAGISILYQSSYMSDFILVKQSRLEEVMALFEANGFDLYSNDSESPPVLTRSRSSSGYSSIDGVSHTKSHSPSSGDVRILPPDLTCVGLEDGSVEHWSSKIIKLVAFPDLIPVPGHCHSSSSSSSMFSPSSSTDSLSDSEEEESLSQSISSLSSIDSADSPTPPKPPTKDLAGIGGPLAPLSPIIVPSPQPVTEEPRSDSPPVSPASFRVPFFSLTRTTEGSSLTTDAELLASLFPPSERYMIICGAELEAADGRLAEAGQKAREEWIRDQVVEEGNDVDVDDAADSPPSEDDDPEDDSEENTLSCLQIDLRKFGLEKHGLVNRFSRVLDENGINHMYSSSYKTANLLVGKKHALRAQQLLRAC
ncbi:hypothetical protein K435DRAFT_641891 [Dendrothele bispora CBS 962.96]|uniref:CASTOR ACT domain-containing protein n=1 Tax=Dendrothele bispora (strain CBS 962.96) TaxID=1314807 RepID=A0A4S8MXY4_DENBC|nr:hypothetical protein K435DRAFT_641891 [Dendrothele bispora CBS 962.96]